MPTHLLPILVAVAALLLLLTAPISEAAIVSANYDIVSASLSFLPYLPPAYITAALFTAKADQPVYYNPGQCKTNNVCNGTDFGRCCAGCDPVTLKPLPGNVNCVCPSMRNTYCIDPQTPLVTPPELAVANQTSMENLLRFEIPLVRACHNLVIDAGCDLGNWNVLLGDRTQDALSIASSARNFAANALINQGIGLCAAPGDGQVGLFGHGLNSMAPFLDQVAPDGVARIAGVLAGFGRFNLTVTEILDPNGLVPLVPSTGQLFYNLPLAAATCDGNTVAGSQYPPPYLPIVLPPVPEPLYENSLAVGTVAPLDRSGLDPTQLSFLFSVGFDTYTNVMANIGDLNRCVLDLSAFRTADGQPIAPDPVAWTAFSGTQCDLAQLDSLVNRTAALVAQFNPGFSLFKEHGITSAQAGVSATMAFGGCQRLADQLIVPSEYVIANETVCYAAPGSPEYYADPCCNTGLLWLQCCSPRPVVKSVYAVNSQAINSQCSTPLCSTQVAQNYAAVTERILQAQCAKETLAEGVASDPLGPGFGAIPGACNHLISSSPANDAAMIACLDANLDPAYKAEFLSLWGLPSNITTPFASLLQQHYNTTGCLQLGAPPYDALLRESSRNDALDHALTACVDAPSCNWDYTRDNQSCLGSYRGNMMCAYCTDGVCTDISTPDLCYNSYIYSRSVAKESLCAQNNGTLDDELLCYFPAVSPRSSCLPSSLCDPGSNDCPPFCYFPTLGPGNCNCSIPASDPAYPICGDLTYDSATSLCKSASISFIEDCQAVSGQFFQGAQWMVGAFNTPASCAIGYCPNNPGLNKTECLAQPATGSCSNYCPGCDQAQCVALQGCNDVELFSPSGGPTCLTDFVGQDAHFFFCIAGAPALPYAGCVFNDQFTGFPFFLACAIFGGVTLSGPASNQTTCESIGRCEEPNSLPGSTSPKTPQECALCGGTWRKQWTWGAGTWTPDPAPTWIMTSWMPRQYAPVFKIAQFFNESGFAADLYDIIGRQQANVFNQTTLCRTAGLVDMISSLACDCAGASSGSCYQAPQLQQQIFDRACSGTQNHFPLGSSGSYVNFDSATQFVPACVDFSADIVPYTLFRRASDNVYSSLFLQALSLSPESVIENSHHVTVGALAGDGLRLLISNGQAAGAYQVCLTLAQGAGPSDIYIVADFATIDETLAPDTFHLLELPVYRNGSQLCCDSMVIVPSQILFPAYRVANPENEAFYDTLTTNQQNCFWAAVAFYLTLWLGVVFRLVNFVLFIIIRPCKVEVNNLILLGLILGFLFAAITLRWIYFVITPLGVLIGAPKVGDLLMSELPFYFFLSIFTLLVAWWVEIYHWASSARSGLFKRMRWILLAVNLFLYAFLIAVIVAFAVTSTTTEVSRGICVGESSPNDQAATVLAKVYKITVAVIAAILAIGFIVYGAFLVRVLSSGNKVNLRSLIQFTAIGVTCALGLLVQCGVLLYATFSNSVNTTAALIVLIVAEVIPGTVLVVTMRPPRTQSSALKELMWCCLTPDTGVTGTTDSRFSASSKSGSRSDSSSVTSSVGDSRF